MGSLVNKGQKHCGDDWGYIGTWTWGVYEAVHKNGAAQGHAEWEERASRREESRAYGQHVAA